jgi:hypothetical protein
LQRTEWKYDSSGDAVLLKYISSFLGRLSHPWTQYSMKALVRTSQGEPGRQTSIYNK